MTVKILIICATAFFAQVHSQCLGRADLGYASFRAPLAYDAPCGCGHGLRAPVYDAPCGIGADIAAASSLNAAWGGGLHVSSASPIAPTGLNVASENIYEGNLAVGGNLPFLGTVTTEGVFTTTGAGAVSYNCGDGALGITAEAAAPTVVIAPAAAIAPTAAIAPAAGWATPYGLGRGYAGQYAGNIGGCGCGTY